MPGYRVDEELPPRSSLASSLSSMTYDFERAVADVVDNSIPVESTKIWVQINDGSEGDYGEPYVAIVDNGTGMDATRIREALVYGSPSSMETRNLGRFGLGMKTASTSQAWIVTVASRMSPEDEFDIRQWNIPWLDNPRNNPEQRWYPLIPDLNFIPSELFDLLEDSTGTIVLWTDLSKMIPNIRDLNQGHITRALTARARRCRAHLELVFHRFIQGTLDTSNIQSSSGSMDKFLKQMTRSKKHIELTDLMILQQMNPYNQPISFLSKLMMVRLLLCSETKLCD